MSVAVCVITVFAQQGLNFTMLASVHGWLANTHAGNALLITVVKSLTVKWSWLVDLATLNGTISTI